MQNKTAAEDDACQDTVEKVPLVNKFDDGSAEVAKENKLESSFQSFERVLSTPDTIVKCYGDIEGAKIAASSAGTPKSEREAVYLFQD